MSDIEFVDGLVVKPPREGSPDFIKGSISIKRENLITWLSNKTEDWINVDVKESKGGKWYAAVNDWKPSGQSHVPGQSSPSRQPDSSQFEEGFDDDIPFR